MTATFREWYLPKVGDCNDLTLRIQPKYDPVTIPYDSALVKIHAVSLQRSHGGKRCLSRRHQRSGSTCVRWGWRNALGSGVTPNTWKVGDRLCANFSLEHLDGPVTSAKHATSQGGPVDGCLTEYRVYPVRSLVKIPSHLSYEEGATLPCAALTAYSALLGLRPLKAGDTILVLGSGGVSVFGLQLAIASGATVIATTSSDEKAAKIKALGADHVINYNTNPDWEQEVLKLTNGEGVDHVIEVTGPTTLQKSMEAAKMNGCIHIIGLVGGLDASTLTQFVTAAIVKVLVVRGVLIGSVAQFESMNRLIEKAQIHPVIDKVFSFDQAIEAYQYLESQKHVGKVVIKLS